MVANVLPHAEQAVIAYPEVIEHLAVLGTTGVSVLTGDWPDEVEFLVESVSSSVVICLNTAPPRWHRIDNGDGWQLRRNPRRDYHFFNPAGRPCRVQSLGRNRSIEVGLDEAFCRQVLDEAGIKTGSNFEALANVWGYDDFLSATLRELARLSQNPTNADAILADHLAHSLVLHLARRVGARPSESADGHQLSFRQMRTLRLAVEQRLAEPLTLRDLAEAVGLTPTYFCRVFKRTTGETPVRWLQGLRAERALVLLATPGRPPGDTVARACGFANRRHLARVLRQRYGRGIVDSTEPTSG